MLKRLLESCFIPKKQKTASACYVWTEPDSNDVIRFKAADGQIIYNPFEVALQASHGVASGSIYTKKTKYLIPRYTPIEELPDPRSLYGAQAAMDWLKLNETHIDNTSIWYYLYHVDYFGDHIKPPWISSYGQSHVAMAFLHWFLYTNDKEYLETACRAMQIVVKPIEEGGLAFSLKNGVFYEELPNNTHIFNAHLFSLVALMNLIQFGESSFIIHLERGIEGFKELSGYMDSGVWSNYDVPKVFSRQIQCRLHGSVKELLVKNFSLEDACTRINLLYNYNNEKSGLWLTGLDLKFDNDNFVFCNKNDDSTGKLEQHNYINFKGLKCIPDSGFQDYLLLSMKYISNVEGELNFYLCDFNGAFYKHTQLPKIVINPGEHFVECKIPVRMLTLPLAFEYHKFHIMLLDELSKKTDVDLFRQMSDVFRRYNSEYCYPV